MSTIAKKKKKKVVMEDGSGKKGDEPKIKTFMLRKKIRVDKNGFELQDETTKKVGMRSNKNSPVRKMSRKSPGRKMSRTGSWDELNDPSPRTTMLSGRGNSRGSSLGFIIRPKAIIEPLKTIDTGQTDGQVLKKLPN
jgi:hypothetical protein